MSRRGIGAWLVPAIVWILAVALLPTLFTVVHAFLAPRYDEHLGRSRLVWVGLDNFRRFFADDQLTWSVVWTVTVAVVCVALQVVFGLALALLAWHAAGRWTRAARGLLAAPMLMAPVAVAYLATTVFAQEVGLINGSLIRLFSLSPEVLPSWRSNPWWAMAAIVVVEVWQWTPFCFLIFLAALAAQPKELYEAALTDGAGPWATLVHVTLPLLRPMLVTVALLRLVESLKLFDVPYGLTRGGPGTWTTSYGMWIKEVGLTRYDMALACAMGLLLLVVLAVSGSLALWFLRRMIRSSQD